MSLTLEQKILAKYPVKKKEYRCISYAFERERLRQAYRGELLTQTIQDEENKNVNQEHQVSNEA
jgi:hypothetical protein